MLNKGGRRIIIIRKHSFFIHCFMHITLQTDFFFMYMNYSHESLLNIRIYWDVELFIINNYVMQTETWILWNWILLSKSHLYWIIKLIICQINERKQYNYTFSYSKLFENVPCNKHSFIYKIKWHLMQNNEK